MGICQWHAKWDYISKWLMWMKCRNKCRCCKIKLSQQGLLEDCQVLCVPTYVRWSSVRAVTEETSRDTCRHSDLFSYCLLFKPRSCDNLANQRTMITLDSSNLIIGHIIDVHGQVVSAEPVAEHKKVHVFRTFVVTGKAAPSFFRSPTAKQILAHT